MARKRKSFFAQKLWMLRDFRKRTKILQRIKIQLSKNQFNLDSKFQEQNLNKIESLKDVI